MQCNGMEQIAEWMNIIYISKVQIIWTQISNGPSLNVVGYEERLTWYSGTTKPGQDKLIDSKKTIRRIE